LDAVARIMPNLTNLRVDQATLSGRVSTPLAALTSLRLGSCSCSAGGAPLRLDGAAVPQLRVLDAEASDVDCVALVASHPTVQELVFGGRNATCRGCVRALSECASLRALATLRVTVYEEANGDDGHRSDILSGFLFEALRLPPALRSLDITFVKVHFIDQAVRLDELLATLGCAVGGRLQELSLVLKAVGAAEAEAARNPLLLLPAFPRLETLRLGCWRPDTCHGGGALELLGALVQPLAAARALTPSLRAVELVLSDEWEWGPAQDAGVAGLVRANPGLAVGHFENLFA
jgi:hypothetical protein